MIQRKNFGEHISFVGIFVFSIVVKAKHRFYFIISPLLIIYINGINEQQIWQQICYVIFGPCIDALSQNCVPPKKGKSFEFQSCLALHNILNVLSLVNMDKAFVCVTKIISNVAKNKRANNIMIIIIVSAFRLFLFLLFSALRISSPLSCSLIFSCWIRNAGNIQ